MARPPLPLGQYGEISFAPKDGRDEIADRLFVSPATVRTHVGRAMAKLDARDRAQLVVFAVRSGLTR